MNNKPTPEQLAEEYEQQPKSILQLIAETEREKKAYRNGYEAGVARWVPCKERLPEKAGNYLTISRTGLWSVKGFNELDKATWLYAMKNGELLIEYWLDKVPPVPEEK